jgi:nucleobase:cation symporter-1, NCS1 family
VLMVVGTIYVVWFAQNFLGPFEAFLITLGVPIATWCGVFLADLALRRGDYEDAALFDRRKTYGSITWLAVLLLLIGTGVGWGLVTSYDPHFTWEGYLLGPIGGKTGSWASANLGVAVALAVGFLGYLLLARVRVRRQEAG